MIIVKCVNDKNIFFLFQVCYVHNIWMLKLCIVRKCNNIYQNLIFIYYKHGTYLSANEVSIEFATFRNTILNSNWSKPGIESTEQQLRQTTLNPP